MDNIKQREINEKLRTPKILSSIFIWFEWRVRKSWLVLVVGISWILESRDDVFLQVVAKQRLE